MLLLGRHGTQRIVGTISEGRLKDANMSRPRKSTPLRQSLSSAQMCICSAHRVCHIAGHSSPFKAGFRVDRCILQHYAQSILVPVTTLGARNCAHVPRYRALAVQRACENSVTDNGRRLALSIYSARLVDHLGSM